MLFQVNHKDKMIKKINKPSLPIGEKNKKLLLFITLFFFSLMFLPGLVSAAITYDAGSNTIIVVGDSSCGATDSNPCTFEDIYQADLADNTWNRTEKVGDNTYIFKAKLQIGDGSTWTYFADKMKTIIFTSDVVLDYHERAIHITRHGYFWIGEGDEDTKIQGLVVVGAHSMVEI